jgi:hypothetical protein
MRILTRRDLLRLGGLLGTSLAWGGTHDPMIRTPQRVRAVNVVDHLLLGSADLDGGMAWVEKATGVRPVVGGSHPGMGTRNALLSLGGRQYLEVIAPDPAQTAYNFQIDVRTLTEPRLVTWAAVTPDIERLAVTAREAGLTLFGPRDGSRDRPDGRTLRWRSLGVLSNLGAQGVQPVPFFIQWAADSVHPSQDSPQGCRLQSFVIQHPDPSAMATMLKSLGIDADVRQAATVALAATITSPNGVVKIA